MRTLLEQRFRLKWHAETRQASVYRLTVKQPGTLGPWLKATTANCLEVAGDDPASVDSKVVPRECYGTSDVRNGNLR